MSKKTNFIVIGTAENYFEQVDGKYFYEYLPELAKTHTIIAQNECIHRKEMKLDLDLIDIFITIDYYTWAYLYFYPQYQDKMYVDATVKKYFDKNNVMQDVKNIFTVDKSIHKEWNGKLFLNKTAPTCLHCALNLCLIKSREEDKHIKREDVNVGLWGIFLDHSWKHCYVHEKDSPKNPKLIEDMRNSVYTFKNFFNLITLNNNCPLNIPKEKITTIIS